MWVEREWLGGSEMYDLLKPSDYDAFVKWVPNAENVITTLTKSVTAQTVVDAPGSDRTHIERFTRIVEVDFGDETDDDKVELWDEQAGMWIGGI